MSSAVQAPLENLVLTDPEPSVRVIHSQLRVLVLVNGQPISSYDASDKGAMHVAAVVKHLPSRNHRTVPDATAVSGV